MVEEVEKLETFLTNWLDLARPADSAFRPEDLNAVIEHALLMANVQSLPEGITLRKELEPSLPPVVLDARRLQQALVNLTLNALQAMNGDGELLVRTHVERDEVHIHISDTGVGIPAHILDRIFQPFFTTKLSGSGLGLAVADGIVRDHGGRIDIESQEGEGTTVSIVLPLGGPPQGDASEGGSSVA
jgi:signal transduction histidine kinase